MLVMAVFPLIFLGTPCSMYMYNEVKIEEQYLKSNNCWWDSSGAS